MEWFNKNYLYIYKGWESFACRVDYIGFHTPLMEVMPDINVAMNDEPNIGGFRCIFVLGVLKNRFDINSVSFFDKVPS
jgi:hypothetical protein